MVMTVPQSVLDVFKIGIGPSSSHTVGPMVAAKRFARDIERNSKSPPSRIVIEFYGSLGATGKVHGADKAVVLGLMGHSPDTVDLASIREIIARVRERREIVFANGTSTPFDPVLDLRFLHRRVLKRHVNAMSFEAMWGLNEATLSRTYYSVGGGSIVEEGRPEERADAPAAPFPFRSAADLLVQCRRYETDIAGLMWGNECAWRKRIETTRRLHDIWLVMQACMEHGCTTEGVLPGNLKVPRSAPERHRRLAARADDDCALDWVSLWATAVSEENAAGGRVVTAPTNGAAGVIPAVLRYFVRFRANGSEERVPAFLLTAAAIAMLYKQDALSSNAEAGCQGEVGVACSMAAAALTAVEGGTPSQVQAAAEIGMEHHIGLTCDPVEGLVQLPCIERNAAAALKAISASQVALHRSDNHSAALDRVIKTARETGAHMLSKYKETALGGLAANVVEC
jgi:L-serine dehydratase